ncbi:MAG: sporulation protein YunB [Clostridia bacterium]|nr:sporulation protein YunB [Clostridia bacterium]
MKKRNIAICLFLCMGILTGSILYTLSGMEREMKIFVATKGKTVLSTTLQNALYECVNEEGGNYVEVAKDPSNHISSIHIHSIPLSLLASRLTLVLLEELEQYESDGFGIPLGNLTSVAFLSGKGPLIPVKAVALGTVASEVQTELTSTGINQTLHRVSIRFAVTVRYLSPLREHIDTLYLEVLIAETLIVGEVPIYKD